MNSKKIGKVEAISCIIIIIITHIIINLPQTIMKSTGSSTLLNVLYLSVIILAYSFVLCKLFAYFPGFDIFDIAEFLAGKWLRVLLQILFIVFFVDIIAFTLRIFTLNLQMIYFANIDIAIILLVFLMGAVFVGRLGTQTVARTNVVFLPLILTAMLVLFSSTLPNWGAENFLPILGNGLNSTFVSGISNLYIFSGIDILFILVPYLKNPKDLKKISLISVSISAIYLLFAIAASMLLIPADMNFEPMFTVYFAARRISLGDFLERLDPVFIFVWILSVFSYVSIGLFYVSDLFKKATHIEYNSPMLYCFATLIFVVAMLITNVGEAIWLLSTIYQYASLIFSFGLCFIILILAAIKKKFFLGKTSSTDLSTEENLFP